MSGTDAFVNPTATSTAFTSSMSSSNNSMSPTIMSISASTSTSMSMSMSVGRSSSLFRRSSTTINTKHQKQASLTKNILQTLRRRFTILLASTLLLFGPSLLPKHPTLNPGIPHAHASTTTTSPTPLTPRAKKHLETLIHRYTTTHMFSDDKFDPMESAYRETISDSTTSTYPNLLSRTASSALGLNRVQSLLANPSSSKTVSTPSDTKVQTGGDNKVLRMVLGKVDEWHERYGVDKGVLNLVVVSVGVLLPAGVALLGLVAFSTWQKGMTERMAVERYGVSYLSAEELEDEDEERYGVSYLSAEELEDE